MPRAPRPLSHELVPAPTSRVARPQVVKVDGAATDVELLNALERLGKRAEVVTHTRGIAAPAPPSSPTYLKMQLFMRLLGRKVNCCS
eukprot:5661705-Prymnesium_polylepis.1